MFSASRTIHGQPKNLRLVFLITTLSLTNKRPFMDRPPIFIVGSARSGTTLLRLILDSHPHIASGPETQFLRDLNKIVDDNWHRMQRFGFDKAYWHAHIRQFFSAFQEAYAQKRGKQRWAEKTPSYALHLDFIDALFPESQIIHIIRDGHDVVASCLERWGYRRALEHAVWRWKQHVIAAQSFGANAAPDRYFELRYEELVTDPEPVLKDLFAFLDEPWDPIVLRYNELNHDLPEFTVEFTDRRREKSGESSAIYSSRVGAGREELNFALKGLLRAQSGALLKQLGYL